jgi:hypothetical protein
LLVQRQDGVNSALNANEKIRKIPAKSSGGGKRESSSLSHATEPTIWTGAKKEALQALEAARAAEEEAAKSLASLEALFQTQIRDTTAKTDNQTGATDAASPPAGSDSISQSPAPEDAKTDDNRAAAEPVITPVARVDLPASGDVIMDNNANPTETGTQEKDQTGSGAGAAPPVQSSEISKGKKRAKASKAPEAPDGGKDSSAPKKAKVSAPVDKDIDSGTPSVAAYRNLNEEGKEKVQGEFSQKLIPRCRG